MISSSNLEVLADIGIVTAENFEDEMRKVHVEFDVLIPVSDEMLITDEQVEDWLRFELNDNGTLTDSPISDFEVEPIFGTFGWSWK